VSIGGRIAIGLLISTTLALEVWAYFHFQNAPDGVFANLAIFIYAIFAAAFVLLVDYLYRTIRYPPHRRPPRY
jgi:hypothetical protein